MIRDAFQQPKPTRVLLVGQDWELLDGVLPVLVDCGAIELLGPAAADDAGMAPGAALLLLAPDAGGVRDRGEAVAPALRCVAAAELDAPELYDDADDFIVAPCRPAELVKRILRLAQGREGAGAAAVELLRVGGIALNPATYQVTANGRPVELAWLEFRLLLFLMTNLGKVFTRDELLANVWGVENIGGTRTVDVHIRRLRYKLENGGDTYFRTVKNVGYGMMAP